MGFAVIHSGRRTPRPSDRLSTADDLDRALAAAGGGALSLWEVADDPDDGFTHMRLFRWGPSRDRCPDALADEVRTRMLASVSSLYLRGDCWVLAHVGAARHGLPVAMVVHGGCREGEPDHLALDLGDGRYLDANGVSSEAELLSRSPGRAVMPDVRLDADAVVALYDRLYAVPEEGDDFACKLAHGFKADTEALFSMCLDRFVEAGYGPTPRMP